MVSGPAETLPAEAIFLSEAISEGWGAAAADRERAGP